MNGISINQVDNANVYINGNNFLGRAKSIKLPEFEVENIEHKALGLVGTLNLPTGVSALEGEIIWDGFYPEVASLTNNPFKTSQIMVRANVRVFNSQGLAEEQKLVMILNGYFSKTPLGEYKPKEAAEYSMTFKATSIKQTLDGKEVLLFDAMTNKWQVDGVDILDKYRRNIGS